MLWPDHEVYDLMERGVPLKELPAHTTAVPAIFSLGNGDQTAQLVDSRQFTHIAVVRRWGLSGELEREARFWAVATRRGMAIDAIEVKHSATHHLVWMEVVQLDAQVHLWGIHISFHHSPPLLHGPSYIRHKQHTWYMEIASA